jgi:hypothetical protein
MLNNEQLRELIIKPVLEQLILSSPEAEELLVFTCAVESLGGTYLKQVNGPALGIYQMEPATYVDIWQNYIKGNTRIFMIMLSNFHTGYMPSEDRMIYDLRFATAMARLHYDRVKEALPNAKDENAIWDYYKKYYNTEQGAAQKVSALIRYHDFLKC